MLRPSSECPSATGAPNGSADSAERFRRQVGRRRRSGRHRLPTPPRCRASRTRCWSHGPPPSPGSSRSARTDLPAAGSQVDIAAEIAPGHSQLAADPQPALTAGEGPMNGARRPGGLCRSVCAGCHTPCCSIAMRIRSGALVNARNAPGVPSGGPPTRAPRRRGRRPRGRRARARPDRDTTPRTRSGRRPRAAPRTDRAGRA